MHPSWRDTWPSPHPQSAAFFGASSKLTPRGSAYLLPPTEIVRSPRKGKPGLSLQGRPPHAAALLTGGPAGLPGANSPAGYPGSLNGRDASGGAPSPGLLARTLDAQDHAEAAAGVYVGAAMGAAASPGKPRGGGRAHHGAPLRQERDRMHTERVHANYAGVSSRGTAIMMPIPQVAEPERSPKRPETPLEAVPVPVPEAVPVPVPVPAAAVLEPVPAAAEAVPVPAAAEAMPVPEAVPAAAEVVPAAAEAVPAAAEAVPPPAEAVPAAAEAVPAAEAEPPSAAAPSEPAAAEEPPPAEAASAAPEPAVPEAAAEPEPAVPEVEPAAPEAEPAAPEAQPAAAEPEPEAVEPDTAAAEPEPAAEAEAAAAEPEAAADDA